MTDDKGEIILARAREIQEERGLSLVDAMLKAEAELEPRPEIQTEFTVTFKVKPRVGRWIVSEFAATGTHKMEERLAAYLETVMSRARVLAMRFGEEAPDIVEGRAVTMRRAQFQEKAPKG